MGRPLIVSTIIPKRKSGSSSYKGQSSPFESDLKSDLESALKNYFNFDFNTEFFFQESVMLVANYVTTVVGF